MQEFSLNIMGTEWIFVIFVALLLLLGTNRLPEAAKKIGKIVGEYNKAKNSIQKEMTNYSKENLDITGPVKDEKEKLELMAKSLGINTEEKTDEELRKIIDNKFGRNANENEK